MVSRTLLITAMMCCFVILFCSTHTVDAQTASVEDFFNKFTDILDFSSIATAGPKILAQGDEMFNAASEATGLDDIVLSEQNYNAQDSSVDLKINCPLTSITIKGELIIIALKVKGYATGSSKKVVLSLLQNGVPKNFPIDSAFTSYDQVTGELSIVAIYSSLLIKLGLPSVSEGSFSAISIFFFGLIKVANPGLPVCPSTPALSTLDNAVANQVVSSTTCKLVFKFFFYRLSYTIIPFKITPRCFIASGHGEITFQCPCTLPIAPCQPMCNRDNLALFVPNSDELKACCVSLSTDSNGDEFDPTLCCGFESLKNNEICTTACIIGEKDKSYDCCCDQSKDIIEWKHWELHQCCDFAGVTWHNKNYCCSGDFFDELCIGDQIDCCLLSHPRTHPSIGTEAKIGTETEIAEVEQDSHDAHHAKCCEPDSAVFKALAHTHPHWTKNHCPHACDDAKPDEYCCRQQSFFSVDTNQAACCALPCPSFPFSPPSPSPPSPGQSEEQACCTDPTYFNLHIKACCDATSSGIFPPGDNFKDVCPILACQNLSSLHITRECCGYSSIFDNPKYTQQCCLLGAQPSGLLLAEIKTQCCLQPLYAALPKKQCCVTDCSQSLSEDQNKVCCQNPFYFIGKFFPLATPFETVAQRQETCCSFGTVPGGFFPNVKNRLCCKYNSYFTKETNECDCRCPKGTCRGQENCASQVYIPFENDITEDSFGEDSAIIADTEATTDTQVPEVPVDVVNDTADEL